MNRHSRVHARLALLVIVILLLCLCSGDRAFAQVPPHPPGTICFTPQFWCWVQSAGTPGASCACFTPLGWVKGFLG